MLGRRLRTGLVLLAIGGLGACAGGGAGPPPVPMPSTPAMETRGLFRIVCDPAPVFAEPSEQAPRLATLDAGALTAAVDDGSIWAVVRADGTDGFMDWRCLTPPEDFDPDATIAFAPAAPAPPPFQISTAPSAAPRGSGLLFDAPLAFDRRPARFHSSGPGGSPDDRPPTLAPPPAIPRPRVAAITGPSFAPPDPAPLNAPGLRPPLPEEQFGVRGTRPPVAAPPGAPGHRDLRPLTRFGPPPRYSAVLKDARGGALPQIAHAPSRAPPANPSQGRYAVQIGAYRAQANAARAVARAQSMGFAPKILRAGPLHRIRLTGFGDYTAAAAARARYLAAGGAEAFIVRM